MGNPGCAARQRTGDDACFDRLDELQCQLRTFTSLLSPGEGHDPKWLVTIVAPRVDAQV